MSGTGINEIMEIRKEEVKGCYLCGNVGSSLYSDLADRLFGAPGRWGFLQCEVCGLVWSSPRPVPSDIGKVYETYFTHVDGETKFRFNSLREKLKRSVYATVPGYERIGSGGIWSQLGKLATSISSFKEIALLGSMCLNTGGPKGRLLDIGCGNGDFLAMMREAGWDVFGVEPDPAAANFARETHGISVRTGSLEEAKLPANTFDAVTLSHVIEHVYDPVELLRECRRVLTDHGKVVMVTPNVASLGHQIFKSSWVALDPPRHLHLFNSTTLGTCCDKAGLIVTSVRTSSRIAPWTWAASKTIARKGTFVRKSDHTLGSRLQGLVFQLRQNKLQRTRADAGEELVLICSR